MGRETPDKDLCELINTVIPVLQVREELLEDARSILETNAADTVTDEQAARILAKARTRLTISDVSLPAAGATGPRSRALLPRSGSSNDGFNSLPSRDRRSSQLAVRAALLVTAVSLALGLPALVYELRVRTDRIAEEVSQQLKAAVQRLDRQNKEIIAREADLGAREQVVEARDRTMTDALTRAIREGDPATRKAAIEIIASLGPAGSAAFPALIKALDDPVLREPAARVLARYGGEDAQKAASKVLTEPKPNIVKVSGTVSRERGLPYGAQLLVWNPDANQYQELEVVSVDGRTAKVRVKPNDILAVRVHNDSDFHVAVMLTIDGVGRFALAEDKSRRGMVDIVRPRESRLFTGWYLNHDKVAQFKMSASSSTVMHKSSTSPEAGTITISFAAAWLNGEQEPPNEQVPLDNGTVPKAREEARGRFGELQQRRHYRPGFPCWPRTVDHLVQLRINRARRLRRQ